eukprot:TRINITY_DN1098_c0_g3_i1.p1 TRINITY_DN1098_c0_g3~~TRINITY_DN1098_c0_g3_i1.p1  ORF type:complete len:116 (-),score=22.10 TRINITY_DN1098_c0_g3_i1:145-492(-)
MCNLKSCTKDKFPLKVTDFTIEESDVDPNPDFLIGLLPKLEWGALVGTAKALGVGDELPSKIPEDASEDADFLTALHHVIMEVEIKEAKLVCNGCGRVFPVSKGVPNMVLREDEV